MSILFSTLVHLTGQIEGYDETTVTLSTKRGQYIVPKPLVLSRPGGKRNLVEGKKIRVTLDARELKSMPLPKRR